ncbi:MAG: acyltransferase family protein [Gammaproteobacteria bacterium]
MAANIRPSNHFDSLRILFCGFVVFSHSFALGLGSEKTEPLVWFCGNVLNQPEISLGALGVDGFFVISGFLIAMSWERNNSILIYLKRRIARIYPGFIVASIVGAYIVPYFAVSKPNWEHIEFTDFLIRTLRLKGMGHPLAFENNIFPRATNGSLWSISYEFWCYIGVALLGVSGLLVRRSILLLIFGFSLLVSYIFASTGWRPGGGILGEIFGFPPFWARLLPYYLVGVVAYRFRGSIKYNSASVIMLLLTTIVLGFISYSWSWIMPITWAYVIFYLAFFEKLEPIPVTSVGDCSYGAYLYAFPIQQLCVMAYGGSMPPMLLFAVSLPSSLIAGLLSWHLVEKWFIRSSLLSDKVRTLFSFNYS